MSKSEQSIIKDVVLEFLKDGKNHSKKEIEDLLLNKTIIKDKNSSALRNALHGLKKSGIIKSESTGYYRISDGLFFKEKDEEEVKKMSSVINVDELKDMLSRLDKEFDYLNSLDCRRCPDEENICARQKFRMLDEFKINFLKKYN